jgi:hypothetical protein
VIALFPPAGKPKEMCLLGSRILAADRPTSAFQSIASPLCLITGRAGGGSLIGSAIGGREVSLSRGRAKDEYERAGRVRRKAVIGIVVGEDWLINRDVLMSTPMTRA